MAPPRAQTQQEIQHMAARAARGTAKGATATRNRGKAAAAAAEASEYEEVKGGGDFAASWDFENQGDLVGTYTGTVEKEIKGEDRILHTFTVDGEDVEAWGAAILNSRLEDVDPGTDVKVVKSGAKIKTKGGREAWEYKVFVKRGAVRKGR